MATDGDDTSSSIFIDDLIATNPSGTQYKYEGDDHLRFIKKVLKNTFPNITGAVTPTQAELNYVDGVTSQLAGNSDTATLTNKTLSGCSYTNGISKTNVTAVSPTSATIAPTTSTSDIFTTTIVNTAITSLTFTGVAGQYRDITWVVISTGTGGMANSVWPSTVKFSGTKPAIAAGSTNIFKFAQQGATFYCYAYATSMA